MGLWLQPAIAHILVVIGPGFRRDDGWTLFQPSVHQVSTPRGLDSGRTASGEGILIISTAAAQRRALFILALTLLLGASRFITQTWAAGALAVGKCGAFGQAYDYAAEAPARASALKHCKGDCTAR